MYFEILSRLTLQSAPGVGADADDTAKGLKALEALDVSISSERMIHEYEQPECFKTYSSERDPSFTTNCNVLVAILRTREATKYEPQIQKIVRFVCQQWHLSVKPLIDKWVCSEERCFEYNTHIR